MPKRYDIVIVGGGPAGSTLARLLSSKFHVLLLELRSPELRPEKCCGGLVAPDAQAMLARFQLGLPRTVLGGPQLFVVRTLDLGTGLERHYQRFYFNADRGRFDEWLLSLVPQDVDILYNARFRTVVRQGHEMLVSFVWNGEESTAACRFLVGADGAGSSLRRMIAPGCPDPRRYIAIQGDYAAHETHPSFTAVFDKRLTDFYGWAIPKDERFLVGVAFPWGHGARHGFDSFVQRLTDYGIVKGHPRHVHGAPLLRPSRLRQVCTGRENIFLIGESGGFISPSSAEGFSFAFKSAEALADALNADPAAAPQRYRELTGGLRRNIFLKTLKGRALGFPLVRRLLMSSGLSALSVRSR